MGTDNLQETHDLNFCSLTRRTAHRLKPCTVHWMDRPSAQATVRNPLDGPPIGSSHCPESTSTDRPSAQATVLSPLDGPPISSSHDPESTSTDRPSAQATVRSQHRRTAHRLKPRSGVQFTVHIATSKIWERIVHFSRGLRRRGPF